MIDLKGVKCNLYMEFNKLIPEFTVSNFQKSLHFYTEILCFTVDYTRDNPNFAFLSLNGSQIMIQQEEAKDKWSVGKMEYPYGRGINFQIDIKNIQQICDSLKNNNYPIFKKIEDHYYKENNTTHHERELLVQDPDGYLLRFSEYVEDKGNINIRPATNNDQEWINKFISDSWGSTIIVSTQKFDTSKLPTIIVEDGSSPKGVSVYHVDRSRLEIVAIKTAISGKGYGKALIDECKKIAKEKGLKSVFLITTSDNLNAMGFYQKQGLRMTKIYRDEMEKVRKIKPEIPLVGENGIPLKDEVEFEYQL